MGISRLTILEALLNVDFTREYLKDIENLPEEYDTEYLDDAVKLLRQGKKLSADYKPHDVPVASSKFIRKCIHIPCPAAMVDGYRFSDWQLYYCIEANTLKLLGTGTHEYMQAKTQIKKQKNRNKK